MKKQLGLRVEKQLKDELDDRTERTGRPVTAILEEYIAAGLARDNGELVEQQSLPEIRKAVRDEVHQAIQELRGDLLAGLIVKGIRNAGIAQRMVYALLGR